MARQRKLSPERKELIKNLLSHYKPEDGVIKGEKVAMYGCFHEVLMQDELGKQAFDIRIAGEHGYASCPFC